MKAMIFLMTLVVTNTTTIHMKSDPSNPGSFTLNKKMKLIDEDEGFYDRVVSIRIPDIGYASLDVGNRKIYIYDKQGEVQNIFGKEGNGPGELSRPGFLRANKEYLYVMDAGRLSIFKFDGTFVNSIKEFGWPEIHDDQIIYDYSNRANHKLNQKIYNISGSFIKEIPNPSYTEMNEEVDVFDEKRIKSMLNQSYGKTYYRDGYVQIRRGAYQLEYIVGSNKTIITRDFDRIKATRSPIPVRVEGERTKEIDDRIKKMNAAVEAITGGYQTDISYIVGSYQDYLFVKTTSESNEDISIDIISPEFTLYDQLKMKGDTMLSFAIFDDELIINRTNDEDGPYSEVYTISLNKF